MIDGSLITRGIVALESIAESLHKLASQEPSQLTERLSILNIATDPPNVLEEPTEEPSFDDVWIEGDALGSLTTDTQPIQVIADEEPAIDHRKLAVTFLSLPVSTRVQVIEDLGIVHLMLPTRLDWSTRALELVREADKIPELAAHPRMQTLEKHTVVMPEPSENVRANPRGNTPAEPWGSAEQNSGNTPVMPENPTYVNDTSARQKNEPLASNPEIADEPWLDQN